MTQSHDEIRRTTLSRADCLDLLRASDLARVVISVRCLPAALPARIFVVGEELLLLASPERAVLQAADRAEVLSVQIDGLESGGATWSVMASGIARPHAGGDFESASLNEAVTLGASVVEVPLSVVVGERIG